MYESRSRLRRLGSVMSTAVLIASAFTVVVTPASAATSRDPWLWPFTPDSIWNMPIGSNAVYTDINLPAGATNYMAVDWEYKFKAKSTDPVKTIYAPNDWKYRCTGSKDPQGTMYLPNDVIVPDARVANGNYETPNNVSSILQPDGNTIVQLEPMCRDVAGGDVWGYRNPTNDTQLTSTGYYGTHFGSGLSGFGGSIRHGELWSPEPLHHALKFNIWGTYLYYNASDPTPGYRWPADRADAGAPTQYFGSNPKLEMGSLVAIAPSVTEASLGLKTDAAKKLFHALQDYGAYLADDTGWDSYAWDMDLEAYKEFSEVTGYDAQQGSGASGGAKDWWDDNNKLITAMKLIDNNGPNSIGGGGTPRAPLAPSTFSATDSTAPSTPSSLRVTGKSTSTVTLNWTSSSDNVRVMEYDIYQGSTKVGSTYGATSYTVKGLSPNTSYTFTVKAKDTGLNTSGSSNGVTISTYDGYNTDFSNLTGWTLSNSSNVFLQYGLLESSNWGGKEYAFYSGKIFSAPSAGNNYVYRVQLKSDSGDNYGKTRVYVNFTDSSNNYFVQLGGGSSNTVELFKTSGGTETKLATYPGSYPIPNNQMTEIAVKYENGGYITITGTKGSTMTTLFDRVQDTTFTSGKIGLGTANTQSFFDNASVVVNEQPVVNSWTTDFNSLNGWTTSNATNVTLAFAQLELSNWSGREFAFYKDQSYSAPTASNKYTYKVQLKTDSGDNYGKTFVYFNYTDINNTYFVRFGGGTANSVELGKRIGGTDTVIASYSGSYPIPNSIYTEIAVTYENGGLITVTGNKNGTATSLFNKVQDTAFNSGKVGVGTLNTQSFFDNASVTAQ
ncbi:fibronectin type III domain-containing protein [Paenibacillus roseipurpureus]|uniref:Fibronectin type III domain-containing protein n=1 Tax=Paenibacillus roseopurpureus TaxID=2918901 RepID=A0AA96LRM0_9BACL|nr:fibronectin type III domain-containing protein [Paenibacillus sp. MBLB1832]WNR45987.1 fibronectin type III domain-containing protein [Paenibacillus sp. MBLB1832]